VDPDQYPDRIRIQWDPWIRIRIQIRNPDPDQVGRKWPRKIENILSISSFEVLDVLF
jgi:hypothetical protein